MRTLPPCFAAACALLAACEAATPDEPAGQRTATATQVPGDTDETAPFAGIAADEVLQFTGTEPFWAGEVAGGKLIYETPENIGGSEIAVERFAGRGGVSFSGTLGGERFEMVVTELQCSDGMSDRTYPFTVTLEIGADKRDGCAWSEQHPFAGPEHP